MFLDYNNKKALNKNLPRMKWQRFMVHTATNSLVLYILIFISCDFQICGQYNVIYLV